MKIIVIFCSTIVSVLRFLETIFVDQIISNLKTFLKYTDGKLLAIEMFGETYPNTYPNTFPNQVHRSLLMLNYDCVLRKTSCSLKSILGVVYFL